MLLGQRHKLKILLVISFVITTLAACIYLGQAYMHFKDQSVEFPLGSMLVSVFGSYYCFLLFVPMVYYLKNRFDLIRNWKLVFIHSFFAAIMASAHIIIASVFNHFYIANEISLFTRIKYGLQNDFLMIFIGYCGLLVTAYFIDYYFKFKQKETELIELKLSKTEPLKHIVLRDKGKLFKVVLGDIKYFEAFDNYLKVFTVDRLFVVRKTLKDLNNELKDFGFIRIHRSYIVNAFHVKSIKKQKSGGADILLKTDETLKMSRSYKKNLEQLMKS
ncbi:LytTR family DNA-binding domain-containing protein [uncultured Psychroserpens sp.]|uniref:LytR/AlgR family response regulator transcription factor n=1 Tax=uncultured Psychroserpens sp. TaxID=255436 RepID=UPI002627C48C|nr:LytTR family DNA-binding domain-containing protein [uncultured Psychroserpens sp.]